MLYESVNRAMRATPQHIKDEVKAVAPSCLRQCCKPDVQIDTATATPSIACRNGTKFDFIGLQCVKEGGNASTIPPGYAPCPSGLKVCALSNWHRPLCVSKAPLFGVDGCALFEPLALTHKLPKLACPVA